MTYFESERTYNWMKRVAEFKSVALFRALGMKYVAVPLARLKGRLDKSFQGAVDTRFIFYDETGDEIKDKDVSFLFFPDLELTGNGKKKSDCVILPC